MITDESAERSETDDEGIERDSGDSDDDSKGGTTRAFNFDAVLAVRTSSYISLCSFVI